MRAILVALVAAVALETGCTPSCTPDDPRAPLVILVTIDTLRADHVGAYGSSSVRTPHLDRFAQEGAWFRHAYSQANVTLPSHASLLTSRPLAAHGLISNATSHIPPLDGLPARFAAAGYRTAAFVSTPHLGPQFALGRALTGIETYDAPARTKDTRRAPDTVDRMLRWLRGHCAGPAFVWLHLWDPHMPYAPPAPYDRAYYVGDPAQRSTPALSDVELAWALHDLTALRSTLRHHTRAVRTIKDRWHLGRRRLRRLLLDPTSIDTHAPGIAPRDELVRHLTDLSRDLRRGLPYNATLAGFLTGVEDLAFPRARYAAEVSFVDTALGTLHDTLDTWGLRDRAIVVITSDHGEGLGEHDVYFDHFGAWEEMRHVPLVVWAPGRIPPRAHDTLTSGLDVAPTVLALAGVPIPATMVGRDLLASPPPDGPLVLEHGNTTMLTLHDGRWKLTRLLAAHHYTSRVRGDAGRVTLFDLVTDPTEHHDRSTAEPVRVAAMMATLDAWTQTHRAPTASPPSPKPPLPADQREKLRALGYVE